MKYLTKEWYETMQRTGLHILLRPLEEARSFSEELFQRLYAECEQEHLDSEKRVCDVDITELADRLSDSSVSRVDGTPISEEERNAVAAFQQIVVKSLREAPQRIFDPEKAKAEYHERYLGSLENAQRKLPDEIKQKIADLRVFALRYAAPEIIEEVTAYSNACDEFVKQTMKNCSEQQKALFADCRPGFFEHYDIHDHHVKSARFSRKDLILEPFDPYDWIYTFKDAEILEQEHSLDDAYLLYDEIYPVDGGYEFHFLFDARMGDGYEISQITLRCSDLEITTAPVQEELS